MSKVCIIGGGAAGLCAARHLANQKNLIPVVYEQSSDIGGTWVYNDKVGKDENGMPIHSSMYKSLKTNLPKEVMAFPDFPFPSDETESFLHHTQVCGYLKNYTSHFGLEKFIHLNSVVKHVVPHKDKNSGWSVTVENLVTNQTVTSDFKAMMICNGHYSIPSLPDLPGLSKFSGVTLHSHDYRNPDPFEGKTVAVLGAAASGTDIGCEIATVAKQVYLCHNNPFLPSPMPSNFEQKRGITEVVGSRELKLSDGTSIADVDVILFCTGYHYSFPFLDATCHPKVENRIVWPLYKHMISIDHPTLCFIGIPIQICPFPQFDIQVQFFVKSLTGEMLLPAKEAMLEDSEQEKMSKLDRGIPLRHFHKMGTTQWDYNRSLCKLANLNPLRMAVETLYNDVHERRRHHLTSYKKDIYELLTNSDEYKRVV